MDAMPAAAAPDLWFVFLKSFSVLALLLVVMLAVLFLIKRFFFSRRSSGSRNMIEIRNTIAVGPKERLVLIDCMGTTLLLGVTPHTVTCLSCVGDGKQKTAPYQPAGAAESDLD